ncbi:hypothetical protein MRX96_056407 [Rhipicephalus microplus]
MAAASAFSTRMIWCEGLWPIDGKERTHRERLLPLLCLRWTRAKTRRLCGRPVSSVCGDQWHGHWSQHTEDTVAWELNENTGGSKFEFVLTCIGLSVGLGNIWRFPYVVYENGGAAFLIPYVIIVAVIGRPMYYMELVLGQFCSRGPVAAFDSMPIAKGTRTCDILSHKYQPPSKKKNKVEGKCDAHSKHSELALSRVCLVPVF